MTSTTNMAAGNSKTLNILRVLTLLRAQSGATVSDISQSAGIPVATAYRITHALLEEGLILQTEKVASLNGRQPTLYSINPAHASAVCVMIEKTCVTVCLADMAGSVLSVDSFDMEYGCQREDVLEAVDGRIRALAEERWGADEAFKKIQAIYVTAEADVDGSGGRISRFSGASCFDDFDVVSYFQKRYGVPARLDKLLNVEATSSIKRYCRYNFDHYVYLHIGVGFGATIVIDGKIYAGAHGKAGELVRLKTPDGRSWENAYRTSNLYQNLVRTAGSRPDSQLNAILIDSLTPSRSGNVKSLMAVLDRALESGCEEAVALVREAAGGWAGVIRLLYELFDPEVIVIGGDISCNTPYVFELIRDMLSEDEGFEGVVLPAEYEISLISAVALRALNVLYDNLYARLIASLNR